MKRIYEGLGILLKYCSTEDADCCAEHDILYAAGPSVEDISAEDFARLDDLGWSYDESLTSWCIFT